MNNLSEQRILLPHDIYIKDIDSIKTISINSYLSSGGYKALAKAVKELKGSDIIEEVKNQGCAAVAALATQHGRNGSLQQGQRQMKNISAAMLQKASQEHTKTDVLYAQTPIS